MVSAASAAASAAAYAAPTPPPALASAAGRACLHCALPLPSSERGAFCCRGCEAVYCLLTDAGLTRYYELGGGEGHPVATATSDRKWLEPIAARLATSTGLTRVVLDVQGLHCSACVWLLEKVFHREPDGAGIVVNSAVGSVELTVGPAFPVTSFVEAIEAFGYRFGPSLKAAESRASSDLVWRMGLCIAIAMNTMIFGIAIYCGLAEGRLYRLFHALDFALSFLSVLVGGSVFFRSAWQALRRRVLHLDLPIALGILLAFSSSAFTYFTRGGSTSYFDTLNVFIALMLVGRFLQERVVAKNRAYLLASDGAEGLYVRRVKSGAVTLVRCMELAKDDILLVAHQDLVPVDAILLGDRRATFSLDWISGESAARAFDPGDVVPAGAFCQDSHGATLVATTSFDASSVASLLRTSNRRDHDTARATPWWKRLTSIYVAAVITIAGGSFAGWMLATHDLGRTLDVVAAVLIVTCPCAFGIATPLAYELAQAGLRRIGLFVRTPGFLDRAALVTRVVFDKTGTLTTGVLTVENADALAALAQGERAIVLALAVRSSHPKSRAIASALEALSRERPSGQDEGSFDPRLIAREVAGKGLETTIDGVVWRLGSPRWASPSAFPETDADADVVFSRDGAAVAAIRTGEQLRPDAREEVLALAREGYEPCVLSGDSPVATRRMAEACAIPASRAFGARTPEGKAAWLQNLGERDGRKSLFVGDGINDSLVAEQAYCAGTPAIDRPFMATRCDFYFVSPGLAPIRAALHMSKRLARVVRTNLAIAAFYNAVTVTLAVAGVMTPLWCAVLMPVSSLSTVLATTWQLAPRKKTPWTS